MNKLDILLKLFTSFCAMAGVFGASFVLSLVTDIKIIYLGFAYVATLLVIHTLHHNLFDN